MVERDSIDIEAPDEQMVMKNAQLSTDVCLPRGRSIMSISLIQALSRGMTRRLEPEALPVGLKLSYV